MATHLLRAVRPVPALLAKDTLFGGFVDATLASCGRDLGEREGPWYDEHVKVHEYAGLTAAAAQIRSAGCPVLLDGPFTDQIRDVDRWRTWTADLGGEPVRLVWVRCDRATLLSRLSARGRPRDAGKLAGFAQFVARTRPDEPPPVPHVLIDNGSGAAPLAEQVASVLGAYR